jgi:hypothetical protein
MSFEGSGVLCNWRVALRNDIGYWRIWDGPGAVRALLQELEFGMAATEY